MPRKLLFILLTSSFCLYHLVDSAGILLHKSNTTLLYHWLMVKDSFILALSLSVLIIVALIGISPLWPDHNPSHHIPRYCNNMELYLLTQLIFTFWFMTILIALECSFLLSFFPTLSSLGGTLSCLVHSFHLPNYPTAKMTCQSLLWYIQILCPVTSLKSWHEGGSSLCIHNLCKTVPQLMI